MLLTRLCVASVSVALLATALLASFLLATLASTEALDGSGGLDESVKRLTGPLNMPGRLVMGAGGGGGVVVVVGFLA